MELTIFRSRDEHIELSAEDGGGFRRERNRETEKIGWEVEEDEEDEVRACSGKLSVEALQVGRRKMLPWCLGAVLPQAARRRDSSPDVSRYLQLPIIATLLIPLELYNYRSRHCPFLCCIIPHFPSISRDHVRQ